MIRLTDADGYCTVCAAWTCAECGKVKKMVVEPPGTIIGCNHCPSIEGTQRRVKHFSQSGVEKCARRFAAVKKRLERLSAK